MKHIKRIYKIFSIITISFMSLYIILLLYVMAKGKVPINSANGFYLYDSKGKIIENNTWVTLDEISEYLINATISIEDKNFYKHNGFDYPRILKAMFINIKNKKTLEGASTITQQYAKNLFLNFDKTIERKIEEAILTLRIEAHYKKDEILEGYLNTINYGGVFGIENASMYYFNKHAKDLSLAEASILAGIPKSPTNYSPITNNENAKRRQKIILNTMVKNKYITEEEKDKALKEELIYVGINGNDNLSLTKYFIDATMSELKSIKSIPTTFLETGGLKIYTTLDKNAENILEEKVKEYMKDTNDLQISSVIMNPNNGEILAITGGKDYNKSQFNRVINSKRQVGSTMKPLLYYTALENGFTASTTFTSEKTTFVFSDNKKYNPSNYNEIYANKPISMGAAIAYSDNIYAIKTHLFLGEENLVDFTSRLGLNVNLSAIPSLALGTNEINILEMMKAYSTFANEGYKVNPHFITKVLDMNDNVLYEYVHDEERILNKSVVYILNELLSNSYNKELIDYNYPTCMSIAPKISKKYAIKTGTTNTDHLMFGYNKDVIMGVWMGYDDNRETLVSDGNIMKNLWVDTVEEYLKNKSDNWYKTPDNVIGILVDPISGEVATNDSKNKTIYYFIKGTQPNSSNNDLEEAITTFKEY